MLNIAICEDEEQHKNLLSDLINSYQFEHEYSLTTFQFGYDLVDVYKNGENFDVIFLDMHLENEDGIDIATAIRETDSKSHIIITTSLIDYAVQGYSVKANGFLLKPITREKLYPVLKKLVNEFKRTVSCYHEFDINKEKFILRTDEILYFESLGRKIKVVTATGEYHYYGNISTLEKKYKETDFTSCHRAYIVNLKNVKMIKKGTVVLKNGCEIPISTKKNQKVYDEFTKYLAREMI